MISLSPIPLRAFELVRDVDEFIIVHVGVDLLLLLFVNMRLAEVLVGEHVVLPPRVPL